MLVLVVGMTRTVDLVRMLVLVVEVLVVGGTRTPVDRVLMLVLVLVLVARTVDLVVVRMLVEVLENLMLVVDVVVLTDDEVELSDGTAGPVRYQFFSGSPRHSPTVTALYPLEKSEVKI